MKLSTIYQSFAIASFSTTGLATLLFDRLPSNLTFGDAVKLNWTADHDYTLSLTLMKHSSVGSYGEYVDSIFYDLPMASGNMSYDWVVPNTTVHAGDRFSLKLYGTGPMDLAGTTNTTNLFELPENAASYTTTSSRSDSDYNLSSIIIVAIALGCLGAFLLGAGVAVLSMWLWRRRKTAKAGFEQVDKQDTVVDDSRSAKAGGKEAMRESNC